MNKEIEDYDLVTTPALTDIFACQQSSVTKRQTAEQIMSNIANLSAGSTLDGTETVPMTQSGSQVKVTLSSLATYIVEQS